MRQPVNQILDTRALRTALGAYPTGVAIVTTNPDIDNPVGMTINSFCSLSLDPPLVGWCIDRNSACLEAFKRCQGFSISILNAGQERLARRFATRGADKFAGITCDLAYGPLIPEACAWLRCSLVSQVPLGDHLMLVGRVGEFGDSERAPMVFSRGRFGATDSPDAAVGRDAA